jgi:hypothetical protein
MHDPNTVAFEIRYPWLKYGKAGKNDFERTYRESFITIWHVDPEVRGDDDSEGWSFPKVPTEAKWVKELVHDFEFLMREDKTELARQARIEGWASWFVLWLHRASFRHRDKPLSARHVNRALYSQSFPGNRDHHIPEEAERAAYMIARVYLQVIRPRYRHPRWHVWHWRLQIHPLQTFKRWAFSRCAGCKKRFTWGYSPVSGSWYGKGPRWFRREPHVYHSDCMSSAKPIGVSSGGEERTDA